tara:strand:+ start:96 stop:1028 length:933 start_codon:yes stop_codon:yes gene_type:complete
MSENPKISILLPVYNYPDLRPTIDSILSQTFSNFELLICDDGSTPKIDNIEYIDKRIKFYWNEHNLGLGGTLNKLLSNSNNSSKYFSTIEQDDIYRPYFVEQSISFLDNHDDYGMVSGLSEFWDGENVTYQFPGLLAKGNDYPDGKDMFLLNYLHQIKVAQTCMVVRKNIHKDKKLNFSTKYHSLSVDWDYILRFSLVSKIKGLNSIFVRQDRKRDRTSLTKDDFLANNTAKVLLKDFYLEFPHIIKKKDYKYALSTQLYTELGNLSFFSRMRSLLFQIIPLDPDRKRILNRLKKEIFHLIHLFINKEPV